MKIKVILIMDKTAEYFLGNSDIVAFPKLGIEFSFSNVAFTIFGFEIKWYGVVIAFGMLWAMLYCFKRMKEFGIDSDRAIDAVLAGLIAAIVGARSYYIIFDSDKTFADFFKIREGGLAIYGGLIGALLVGGIVAKIRKVKVLPFFDIASLGFLIGQGIGRWGNFFNKECFGSATTLPWGMASASVQETLGNGSQTVILAHPCFFYEFIWCFIGLLLLHFYSKHRKFDGEVFLMYTAFYGIGRLFIEGLRTDSLYLGRLRVSQLLAGLCVVTAISIILFVRGQIKRNEGAVLYRDTDESKALLAEAAEREEKAKAKKAVKSEMNKTEEEKTEVEVVEATEEEKSVDITTNEEEKDTNG